MMSQRAVVQGMRRAAVAAAPGAQHLSASRTAAPAAAIAATRHYATSPSSSSSSSSSAANSKPPVELFGLDGTYASALYTAAVKTQTLESTAKAVESLAKSFKGDAKLTSVLSTPTLTPGDKSSLVKELMKTASIDAGKDTTMKNFMETLAENNRLGVLEGVCDKFAELMSAQRGEIELTVTSAAPLDKGVLRQLEQAVAKSRFVGQGKKLKVVSKVQPDIRGGLIVEVGDRTIDLSVSSKMAKMNKLLRETL